MVSGSLPLHPNNLVTAVAQMSASLLTISVIAILLPGAFYMALKGSQDVNEATIDESVLKISHGVRK